MTTVGMIILVIGVMVFVVAKTSRKKFKGAGILLILGGMFIGIGGSPSRGLPYGIPAMVNLGYTLTVIGIVLVCVKARDHKKEKIEEGLSVIGGTNMDRFYVECVLAGIEDLTVEKNAARAQLFADKYKLQYKDGLAKLFADAMQAHTQISAAMVQKDLSDLQSEEQEKFDALIRYAQCSGKQKTLQILNDRKNELLGQASSIDGGASQMLRGTQEKEKDWAVMGGIANGIAGAGAGVSTALQAQAENAQIRAANNARMKAAMPAYMALSNRASAYRSEAAAIQKEIERVNEKLVDEKDPQNWFSKIAFSNTAVTVSKTGTCTVTTDVKEVGPVMIYGDVPAKIDGTIVAKIYDGSTFVGVAQMVLPCYGVGEDTKLEGMCLNCGQPGKTYTAQFVSTNMWAMEK